MDELWKRILNCVKGPKDNLHCDLDAVPNTSDTSYFCDSGNECGTWDCDSTANGGICNLTCLNGKLNLPIFVVV